MGTRRPLNTLCMKLHALFIVSGHRPNRATSFCNSTIQSMNHSHNFTQALSFFHNMFILGLKPDVHTFTLLLSSCTKSSSFHHGLSLHCHSLLRGHHRDLFLSTSLLQLYSKMGLLHSAFYLLHTMHTTPDLTAWNSLISGFSNSYPPHRSLHLLHSLILHGLRPDSVTFISFFPALSKLRNTNICMQIHSYALRNHIIDSISVGLIDAYCKCGDAGSARKVMEFQECGLETMMMWYVHCGFYLEVMEMFLEINKKKCVKKIMVSVIMACGEIGDLEKGKQIHCWVLQNGMIQSEIEVATCVLRMYGKLRDLRYARRVFDSVREKDVVVWSALISGFMESGLNGEALSLFRDMQIEGMKPNNVTLGSVIHACFNGGRCVVVGKSLHCFCVRRNMDGELYIGTALFSMYAEFELLNSMKLVFLRIHSPDVVVWNVAVKACVNLGFFKEAMDFFKELVISGLRPSSSTMASVLPACSFLSDLEQGACLHGRCVKTSFDLEMHVHVAICDMYVKCGRFDTAESMLFQGGFLEKEEDVAPWNVMISGYAQNGMDKEALSIFKTMKKKNVKPGLVTWVVLLPSVTSMADITEGRCHHGCVIRTGFDRSIELGNCLIDMYGKCGGLQFAEALFNEIKGDKHIVSWNVMIGVYATNGRGKEAVRLMEEMEEVDKVTFVSVLSACRHSGMVEEGEEVWRRMIGRYGIDVKDEHNGCVVDLVGRAGYLQEAGVIVKKMKGMGCGGFWGALMGGCSIHGEIQMAEMVGEELFRIEPENAANYVTLSGLYSTYSEPQRMMKMKEKALGKYPGCSWLQICSVK